MAWCCGCPWPAALRLVLLRQRPLLLDGLSGGTVGTAFKRVQQDRLASLSQPGTARGLLTNWASRCRASWTRPAQALHGADQSLQAHQNALNAEFGCRLACPPGPPLAQARAKLDRMLQNHQRSVGVAQCWRLVQARLLDRFCVVLRSRPGRVFDGAADHIQRWANATSRVGSELRLRRRLQQRRDAHQRSRGAEHGLHKTSAALQAQQQKRQRLLATQLATRLATRLATHSAAELAQPGRLVALGPATATADTATAPAAGQHAATVPQMHTDAQRRAARQIFPPTVQPTARPTAPATPPPRAQADPQAAPRLPRQAETAARQRSGVV